MARQPTSKPKSNASRRSRTVARSSDGGADKSSAVESSSVGERPAESRVTQTHPIRSLSAKRRGMELREYARTQRVYSRFLGVSANETDEQVILEACSKIARMIQERVPFNPSELIARSRSEVALATYRMLDPRRRVSLRQRAQLSRPIHREDRIDSDGARTSLWERTDGAGRDALQPYAVVKSSFGGVESFGSVESISSAGSLTETDESEQGSGPLQAGVWIDPGVITRAIQEGAGEGVVVDSNLDAKAWLEERRDVIRALQRSDEGLERVKRQEKSTLSWLLSVFGR